MVDPVLVEQRVERAKAASVEIGITIGNIHFATPNDIDTMAIRLSRAGPMVPPHCRGEAGIGVCHALIVQALEWRMPILSVINKSYVVSNRGVDRIAFESQMIHAVIERNAPLKGRLRYRIEGEDDDRKCIVWGTFHGESSPHEYQSATLAKLRDARGRNDQGVLRGSPLWDHQPEVQLFYSASRQWARIFCPDVILGAYTPEDPQYEMRDVTPPLDKAAEMTKKLRNAKAVADAGRGFDADHVSREAGRRTVIEGEVNTDKPKQEGVTNGPNDESVGRGGSHDGGGGGGLADDALGGAGGGGASPEVRGDAAGPEAARVEEQGEIFPPDRPKGKGKRK